MCAGNAELLASTAPVEDSPGELYRILQLKPQSGGLQKYVHSELDHEKNSSRRQPRKTVRKHTKKRASRRRTPRLGQRTANQTPRENGKRGPQGTLERQRKQRARQPQGPRQNAPTGPSASEAQQRTQGRANHPSALADQSPQQDPETVEGTDAERTPGRDGSTSAG